MNEPLPPSSWEQRALIEIATASLTEERKKRRVSVIFRVIGFAYVGIVLLMIASAGDGGAGAARATGGHTAVVEMHGVIAGDQVNADDVVEALGAAFADGDTKGVVLHVDSPGGSPVQAGIIHDEIKRLRAKYPDIPLYAVVGDLCASGGYYVAAAADQIYVDKASLVGSIGVLMDGFGFTGSLAKLGVERRLVTSGENKGFMDPFSPVDGVQLAHAKTLLENIHKQFIDVVKAGRGERLKDDPALFSGLFWTGEQAIALGLADAMGTTRSVARDVVKADHVETFTVEKDFAERIAKRLGAAFADGIFARIDPSVVVR